MTDLPVRLVEDRYSRLEAIDWWDQRKLRNARVLVVGAGALGNEVLKNLALLGCGHIVVADMDQIERTNLSRSILFRSDDEGSNKAERAVDAIRAINPDVSIGAFAGNICAGLGLGYVAWCDYVISAVDNREARLFINRACAQLGKTWIDGGIDVLQGIVKVFSPLRGPCYECTMGDADWRIVEQRRSCAMLARRAARFGGTPTTPTVASVIAAIQVQEFVKLLHGLQSITGRGLVFDGLRHDSFLTSYQQLDDCPWHEENPPVDVVRLNGDADLAEIAAHAREVLGGLDAIETSREILASFACPNCELTTPVFQPLDAMLAGSALCPQCASERIPKLMHSVPLDDDWLKRPVSALGIPDYDVLWCRKGEAYLGCLLAADLPRALAEAEGVSC